ncbi:MAG TPA: hypothetical protein VK019_03095 [Pseudomonas sp.]|nr:hypothetical protein [Pseudomonas sp.]
MNDEIDRQVGREAASAYGWNPDDVMVESLADTGDTRCRLLAVRSPGALPSHGRTWAVVEGEVIMPGTAGTLDRVLGACAAVASADVWAEAVAAFGEGVPQGYVVRQKQEISTLAHRRAMEAGGYEFHPPRLVDGEGGEQVVEFFLTDLEAAGLYEVRATRAGDGSVQVSADLLAGDS